jgi:GT2 family glycosyltransferase
MRTVCLAILNYNGVHHLEALLPTGCEAAKNYSGRCTILVLDNRSVKTDVEWITKHFPTVEVVVAPQNDFLFSYNWLAENRSEDILIFLNNDLKLHPQFVPPLVRHFARDDVFAVSATSRDWEDKGFTCGPTRLSSHHGTYEWDYQRENQTLCHTLFTSGGFMAVERKKFLQLGGFNRLYWPGYAEDLDLCYRAWRKGWRSLFEPESIVWHRENGSWNNGIDGRAARLMFRASLLFQWSSLPAAARWWERMSFISLTAFRKTLAGQGWWLKIWLKTWMDWQKIQKRHAALMTTPEELQTILRRIAEPVQKPLE